MEVRVLFGALFSLKNKLSYILLAMSHYLFLSVFFISSLFSVEFDYLQESLPAFAFAERGNRDNSSVMLVMHGYGSNGKETVDVLKNYDGVIDHLIGFDFPDAYLVHEKNFDPEKSSFGTFREIEPVLMILKEMVVDRGIRQVSLYGFSAGGGALINTIAFLNSNRKSSFFLSHDEREKILKAIENGMVILDTPLKSIEEIIAFRGSTKEFEVYSKRYKKNGMVPIHALDGLDGLRLNVIVHFQVPDDALSNRDDALYIDRLKEFNDKGSTFVVIGSDGGHSAYHKSLWDFYISR